MIEYGKVIKIGQLVTVDNIVYRCKKANPYSTCATCDLEGVCGPVPFSCDWNSNFKRIQIGKSKKPN